MKKLKFTDASEFIAWVQIQKRFSKKESLDKMFYLCSLFDNPQNKFKSIHVTGTNGKGSTVSMLNAILSDKGLKVGTFTSPYITCFNERIGYNNHYISDEDLLKYANIILDKYDQIIKDGYELPTFFEFVTLTAFLYFASRSDIDVAILEVGMGGRLDATNVISPVLSIITNVAYDHMQVLGDSLDKILNEKLGIVKDNIPLICGIKDESLKEICQEVTKSHSSKLIIPSYYDLYIIKSDLISSIFDYQEFKNIELSLIGYHQIDNAILVIEAFKILKNIFNLSIDNLLSALSCVKWQGRLETISNDPYILVDGGHNIDGVRRICEFVKNLEGIKKRAIVSISHDKELVSMIKLIDDAFDEIIFTKYTYARSADANLLYQISNANKKQVIANLNDAINYAYQNKCDLTIFMGSLYLVSEVRNIIKK